MTPCVEINNSLCKNEERQMTCTTRLATFYRKKIKFVFNEIIKIL